KVYEKAGYGDRILHRTGHGFGITGHEGPYLAVGYDQELEPGMLVSVEPGIYIPGLGGFRHSDTVLITDDGYVKLTDSPDSLEELTIAL
ncbi:MAG: M24 family metallopeptidase, partial [Proteobacteria bacterium]|nr:M24 family metallopeptidase [Pseudomonadota bacterium]